MIVCVCNRLNERRVHDAIGSGAGTVSSIYRSCGCAAQCGRCAAMIRDMLDQRKRADGTTSPPS